MEGVRGQVKRARGWEGSGEVERGRRVSTSKEKRKKEIIYVRGSLETGHVREIL